MTTFTMWFDLSSYVRNLKEMFPQYYMHCDVCSRFKDLTTLRCIISKQKVNNVRLLRKTILDKVYESQLMSSLNSLDDFKQSGQDAKNAYKIMTISRLVLFSDEIFWRSTWICSWADSVLFVYFQLLVSEKRFFTMRGYAYHI